MYSNIFLKYPLNKKEIKLLDKVWDFIETFNILDLNLKRLRKKIRKKIKKKYSINEFLEYELIAEKILWNLRWTLFNVCNFYNNNKIKINRNENLLEIPEKFSFVKKVILDKNYNEIKNKFINKYNNKYLRSFVNKTFIVNGNEIFIREVEGSSDILRNNYFNLFVSYFFFNRNRYEEFMREPFLYFKNNRIILPAYYIQQDYLFPNLNFSVYLSNRDLNERIRYIKILYFLKNSEMYWFIDIYDNLL